jgi:hypothetical protein
LESARGPDSDRRFLATLEGWRLRLAQSIYTHSPSVSSEELSSTTLHLLNRLLFAKLLTERGAPVLLEPIAAPLHQAMVSPELQRELLLALEDEQNGLAALSVEAIGRLYEQLLSRVIHREGAHLETRTKREVRQAQGVFYTPEFVVEAMVSDALGPALASCRNPADAAKLRVLDPACGCGRFLLGAYEALLQWHLDWFEADARRRAKQGEPLVAIPYRDDVTVEQRADNGLAVRLSHALRRRIVENSLYGVDLDAQAAEVTALSLLAKSLEAPSTRDLQSPAQPSGALELGSLAQNIQVGNALIGSDFGGESSSWQHVDWARAYPAIVGAGGFDVVIGNPPYVLLQDAYREQKQLDYFAKNYTCASYKVDTYHLFMERALTLTRPGGRCSMIVPSNFLTNTHLVNLRRLLLEQAKIHRIDVVKGGVFKGISVDTAIYLLERGGPTHTAFPVRRIRVEGDRFALLSEGAVEVADSRLDEHLLFTESSSPGEAAYWRALGATGTPLGELAFVNFGKQLRNRKIHTKDVIEIADLERLPVGYRPCYTGKNIHPFRLEWSGLACLTGREAKRGGCWDDAKHDGAPKLLTRQIGAYPAFAMDEDGHQCLNTLFMINIRDEALDPWYLLGVLNSTLLRAYWLNRYYDRRGTFPKIKGTYLKKLPIQTAGTAPKRIALANSIANLARQLSRTEEADPSQEQLYQKLDKQVFTIYQVDKTGREYARSTVQTLGQPRG